MEEKGVNASVNASRILVLSVAVCEKWRYCEPSTYERCIEHSPSKIRTRKVKSLSGAGMNGKLTEKGKMW